MELRLKSKIFDSEIKEHKSFQSDYEFIPGYFSDVERICNNNDFLEVYRHVQHFGFPVTNDMIRYAGIPNYSPQSLITQMALTGKDSYFLEMKTLIENPENVYSPFQHFDVPETDKIFTQLVECDRADLTEKFYSEGHSPEDIYCHTHNANATLEVVNVLMKNDYIPSDNIICWYLMHGMGAIARKCITSETDIDFILQCTPLDLDSFNFIEESRCEPYDVEQCLNILYKIINYQATLDVALFSELYKRVKQELTTTEKFDILKCILSKKERFAIFYFMTLMKEDGFSNAQLENQTSFINKSEMGYTILKVQIEKTRDLDILVDMVGDITSYGKIDFYNEDENGFISAQNEKYCNSDSSDESYISSDEDERSDENNKLDEEDEEDEEEIENKDTFWL